MDIIEKLGFLAGGSRFRRIYEKMQVDGDKAYREAGLPFKSSWFPVYYVLSKSGQPQTVMGITKQIAFSNITVKNIINELNKEGLIEIIPNNNDKRSKFISLSEKGFALLEQLKPIWMAFSSALRDVLTAGHPDITSILKRIDSELRICPLNARVKATNIEMVKVLDYTPELKKHFFELAGYWLFGLLKGKLEDEDEFALHNPDKAYIEKGGFVFFAKYKGEIVGCAALKRISDSSFELVKLFVDPQYRNLGIATKLIERCLSRCRENYARELWLQTVLSLREAIKLYYSLGFEDREAPEYMDVLKRTEKIMCIEL